MQPRMSNTQKPPVDWEKARVEYEVAGDSYTTLGLRYGRSTAAMSKHGRANGWVQDAPAAVRRRLADRMALGGKVVDNNPEKREAAIEKAVDARAKLLGEHQTEWRAIRAAVRQALNDANSEDWNERSKATALLKNMRLASQALALTHIGERRAHGIKDDDKGPGDGVYRLVQVEDPYAE
jgi:hypothetical protein